MRRIKKLADAREEEVDAFIAWLKLRCDSSERLDARLQSLIEEALAKFDCTTCARCCKDAYVVVDTGDIARMAKAVGMKRSAFRAEYVGKNEDGDTCFNRRPCPFLKKNLCMHYESRPDCCREYPGSLAVDSASNLDNINANYQVCPAVFNALEALRDFI
ncbi:MAG: YkgJ family cysteine cluster protein [Actinomycetota bacterium]